MTIVSNIYGRSARDGELRQSKSGKTWCRVSVACEAGTDRETGESLTQWLTLVAFGRVAEELSKTRKGQTISAIGRVELNRWRTQDGQDREDLQLIADAIVTVRSARPGGGRKKNNADRQDSPPRARAPADLPFNNDLPF